MESELLSMFGTDSKELESYIRQIKSYEAQLEVIEKSAKEEEELKKNRPILTLVLWTGIAGVHFHVDRNTPEGKQVLESLVPGTELKLVREPDNKYDRWAIAVYTQSDEMIGYITRYKNETIARLMDAGHVFHAYIENRMQTNYQVPEGQRAFTEDYSIPFSVWME